MHQDSSRFVKMATNGGFGGVGLNQRVSERARSILEEMVKVEIELEISRDRNLALELRQLV